MKHAVVDIETDDPLLKKLGQSYIFGKGSILGVGIYQVEDNKKGFYNVADPIVADVLADRDTIKIFHNGVYDLSWLCVGAGLKLAGRVEDTMTRDSLLDAYALSHSLDACCERMNVTGKNKEDTIEAWWTRNGGKGKAIEHLKEMPREVVARYCVGDLEATWALFKAQEAPLKEQNLEYANDIECRLYPFILEMKRNGFRIDVKARQELSNKLEREYMTGMNELRDKYGIEPRIGAPSYLKQIWEIEGLPMKYTAKGSPSFASDVLADINHPVAQQISHLRGLEKLLNTFVDGGLVHYCIGDHIYPDFFPALRDAGGTVTGRYSSRNPNCQNFSAREDKHGPEVRSLFIPEDGYVLGAFDYKQIEYRVFLHFARGRAAKEAQAQFRENPDMDYHDMTMRLLNWQSKGKLGRHLAKMMSFGSLYGLGAKSFAERFKHPLLESHPDCAEEDLLTLAKSLLNEYFAKVPFVRPTMDLIQNVAIQRGYVKTLANRRQRLEDSKKAYKMVNYLVQGSASDILKKGQVDALEAGVFDVLKIHATVHDENVFSAPRTKEGREATQYFAECMRNAYQLRVPIGVDTEMGENWSHCNSEFAMKYLRGEI